MVNYELDGNSIVIKADCDLSLDFDCDVQSGDQPDWRLAAEEAHIKRIVIKSGIEDIPPCAFINLNNIEEVVLPDTIVRIHEFAFEGCSNLRKVNLPKSVVYIGERAFAATGIQFVSVPSYVNQIGVDAFADCERLIIADIQPRTTIPAGLFRGCSKLNEVSIPKGVVNIEAYAFADTNVRTVTLPATIERIGCAAFDEFTVIQAPKAIKSFLADAIESDCIGASTVWF